MTGYDGYQGADDYEGYQPAPLSVHPGPRHASYDIESMLGQAIEMILSAKPLPMSNSVRVVRDEILEVLEAARNNLPEEIREARWALRDREELMAAEIRKAEQLMDRVRAEAARMVDKTEIVRHARDAAERIIGEAEERARTIINEAEDFCDQKLGGMEIVLDRLTKTVRSGRERLRPQVTAQPVASPVAEEFERRSTERVADSYVPQPRADTWREPERVAPETGGGSFFDQDQL